MKSTNSIALSFIGSFFLLFFCCPIDSFGQQFSCFSPEVSPAPLSCASLSHYIPDPNNTVKTVKIALHVMQREAPFSKDNFDENNPAHVAFLNGIVERVNELYSNCNVQWCNCSYQNLSQVRDTRIRFELAGIFYHRDNSGYNNEDGTYQNLYCYDHYAVCKDEILNVFFCQIPDVTSGYGPTTHVMMFNFYHDYLQGATSAWGPGNVLSHEFGHVFGLSHSWFDNSNYPDMCQSEGNVADFCDNRETDCTCGNNVMSYSRLADYFSPLQMARMNLSLMTSSVSKYLKLQNNNTPITITQPTVWDVTRICENDVLIEPGASLTVQCTTIMAPGTRIVVKRGARLIVDEKVIITTAGKTLSVCQDEENFVRWTGIEVWGNTKVLTNKDMLDENYPLESQHPGVVILKTGAVIANAQVGIYAQQRGTPWETQQMHFCGLVSATEAEFRNCRKAAEFISDISISNSSAFIGCTFNQTFLGTALENPVKKYEGVTSWQVSDVSFEGCNFNNLERGIVFGNATTSVMGSMFNKNEFAIELGMSAPMAATQTNIGDDGAAHNTFKYCDWCLMVRSYGFLVVKNNDFEDCSVGVTLEGSSLYQIQDNEFKNTGVLGSPSFVVGIGLLQSGEASANRIICNEFKTPSTNGNYTLIRDGIYAGGNNVGTYFDQNKFSCWYDVRLSDRDSEKGSLPDQVGFSNIVYNEFTSFNLGDHKAEIHTPDPNLELTTLFKYNHPNGICGISQLIPRKPIAGTCAVTENAFNFRNTGAGPSASVTCPSGLIISPLQPGDCPTKECLKQYYSLIQQKDSLLNVDNAASIFTQIQTAPNSSTTLFALIEASPYCSEEILKYVLNSAMSGSNKRDVLAANLPWSPAVKVLAQEKLTESQFNSLNVQVQPGMISLRDSIRGERITLNNKKMTLLRYLTDSLVRAGNYTDADKLFAVDPERFAREARLGLRLQIADYEGAGKLLQEYPEFEQADADFKLIQELSLANVISQTKPSAVDSAALLEIASGHSVQSGYAQMIAGALYGARFVPYIPPPAESAIFSKQISVEDRNKVQEPMIAGLTIFPNPAGEAITVTIPPSEISDSDEVLLFNVNGKLLMRKEIPVSGILIDISRLDAGFYVASWFKNGTIRQSRYFVKTKI